MHTQRERIDAHTHREKIDAHTHTEARGKGERRGEADSCTIRDAELQAAFEKTPVWSICSLPSRNTNIGLLSRLRSSIQLRHNLIQGQTL